ncbi:MAG: DUF4265 domain-containing protein [Myxococcota bacterium]
MSNRRQPKNPVVKVHFPLDPEEDGICGENMWCEPAGNGLYKLWSVPYTVRGVSLHDIIRAKEIDGRLTFVSVAIRAGHSTYAYVKLDDTRFDEFWLPLAELGIESSKSEGVIAIDIPSRADIFDVRRAFRRGQEAGVWDCEEMTCGHLMALALAS